MTVADAKHHIMSAVKEYDEGVITLTSLDTVVGEMLAQVQSSGWEAGRAFDEDQYDDDDEEEYEVEFIDEDEEDDDDFDDTDYTKEGDF